MPGSIQTLHEALVAGSLTLPALRQVRDVTLERIADRARAETETSELVESE